MATYVILMNLTEKGAQRIKGAPKRAAETIEGAEKAGLKVHAFYLTMGQYDYVAIVEGPSDEETLYNLFGLAQAGQLRTVTLKAFSLEQFDAIASRLPDPCPLAMLP